MRKRSLSFLVFPPTSSSLPFLPPSPPPPPPLIHSFIQQIFLRINCVGSWTTPENSQLQVSGDQRAAPSHRCCSDLSATTFHLPFRPGERMAGPWVGPRSRGRRRPSAKGIEPLELLKEVHTQASPVRTECLSPGRGLPRAPQSWSSMGSMTPYGWGVRGSNGRVLGLVPSP